MCQRDMKKINESNISGEVDCSNIPCEGGVYIVTDNKGYVLYVGSSNCLRRRIAYLQSGSKHLHSEADRLKNFQDGGETANTCYILDGHYKKLEKELIDKYDPVWNKIGRKKGKN